MSRPLTLFAVFLAVAVLSGDALCARDEGSAGDNFLTQTISDVVDKVGQYTSGEKGIIDPEYKKARAGGDRFSDGPESSDASIGPLRRPSAAE